MIFGIFTPKIPEHMKPIAIAGLLLLLIASCTKSDTIKPADGGSTVITNDSSAVTGRLKVVTLDYGNNSKIYSTDVYLYTRYEDIARGLFLIYQRSSSDSAIADFGYLLQGNYYVVSSKLSRRDTSVIQVLPQRVNYRNVYLQ